MKFSLQPPPRRRLLLAWAVLGFGLVAAPARVFISELLFNPAGNPDLELEYIEFRGPPNYVIPSGTYFVGVEGDTNGNPGTVQNVFDLAGRQIGANGFLVLLPGNAPYAVDPRATLVVNTGAGPGWGSGSSSSLGHRGQDGQTELENASGTFFLIQTTNRPALGEDIDPDNDGRTNGVVWSGWQVLDSVGVLDSDGRGDIAYGLINFRRNSAPGNGARATNTVVAVGFTPGYVARTGNTTNWAAASWVAGDALAGTAPNWLLGPAASTAPTTFAGRRLNHLGATNFNAPPIPGILTTEPGGTTVVPEGTPPDTYSLALLVAPAGAVTIGITSPPPLQISVDGGATWGTTRTLMLSNTAPGTVSVRQPEDDVIQLSPRTVRIQHAVIATKDATRYPTNNTRFHDVNVTCLDNDWLRLNELKVNPPGPVDEPGEYLELIGTPGCVLSNLWLAVFEGGTNDSAGRLQLGVELSGLRLGSNGLLFIGAPGHPYLLPASTTRLLDPRFAQPGGTLSNDTFATLLIGSPVALVEGIDYDTGNNGVLEGLAPEAVIVDAVAWTDLGDDATLYGGAILSHHGRLPDAASRMVGNLTPRSKSAWWFGDLDGSGPASVTYADGRSSSGPSSGSELTPGGPNNSAPILSDPGPISSTIGDPTNPEVVITVRDLESDPGTVTVTVHSTNQAVLPDDAITWIDGPHGQRRLKLSPVGVGYSEVIVTATDGTQTSQLRFAFAASAMGRPGGRFHSGASDASAAVPIGPDYMLVADDENQNIRLYPRDLSGPAIAVTNLSGQLGLNDFYGDGSPKEVDIEAVTRRGKRLYWVGSHSHDGDTDIVTNRARIFATDLIGIGTNATLALLGFYSHLKRDLVEWDRANGHGLGADALGFAASTRPGVNAKETDGSGFNIEGVCLSPLNPNTGYLAFRAPQLPLTNRAYALIVPMTNFTTIAESGGPPGSAHFGAPIFLNLGCRGIRSIEGEGTNFLIVAGPPGLAFERPPLDFRLFTWTGRGTEQPQLREADLTGLLPEALVEPAPGPWSATNRFQLISDNGITLFYGDEVQAKHLPVRAFRKSRSDWVTLGPVVTAEPVIKLVRRVGEGFHVRWSTEAGRRYQLQVTDHLDVAGWRDLGPPIQADGAWLDAVDTEPLVGSRFYRVEVR